MGIGIRECVLYVVYCGTDVEKNKQMKLKNPKQREHSTHTY